MVRTTQCCPANVACVLPAATSRSMIAQVVSFVRLVLPHTRLPSTPLNVSLSLISHVSIIPDAARRPFLPKPNPSSRVIDTLRVRLRV